MLWNPDYNKPSQEQLESLKQDEWDLLRWKYALIRYGKTEQAENINNWLRFKRLQIEWMVHELEKKKSRVRVGLRRRLMRTTS